MVNNLLCPFCKENNLLRVNILYEDDLWFVVNMEEGSINNAVMAITKRHIETPFEIDEKEWQQLRDLLPKMKQLVDTKEKPQGYNLGWNIYTVGGQNVAHAHLHFLARYHNEPLSGKGIRYAFKQTNNKRSKNKD